MSVTSHCSKESSHSFPGCSSWRSSWIWCCFPLQESRENGRHPSLVSDQQPVRGYSHPHGGRGLWGWHHLGQHPRAGGFLQPGVLRYLWGQWGKHHGRLGGRWEKSNEVLTTVGPWVIFIILFFNIFFRCGLFLKYILNLLQHCLCFIFWPWGVWDLSSLTRDQTLNPYIERQSLNHWTTKEVPLGSF